MSHTPQHASIRQIIRTEVRQRRKNLTSEQQNLFAQQAAERVATHPRIQAASTISVFLSFDGELDTAPLIKRLWQEGKQLCLPVLHPFTSGNLLFLRYNPDTPLVRNKLKILEPALDATQIVLLSQLDIILTPLVAFDSHGQRLGMGGGFYDRTLENWQDGGPYPIGLAHDCQQVDNLPVEHWDVPLPEVITPSKVWQW
ncbi:MAG: 5-formyltetrahydrofolate cyclo-ligase [Ewingella americana]|jgi:5-formyltetrahydrofolate cyclo-ligase|uniref:5-formyltetrahydrofolate cyclo-ligase n=1 Tax=Ewingella americana TaxID=41202 RepID=UPI00242B66E6|nr:5-formyltetrahydrofolate cyclo-ligase [Ewingella americana]MCI1679413.1 5-formyltetrahydrofolate cyclo-ligase [Ewingella americana]MCI1854740.1 5-formyltetrahydrofolate cyclo-ligase [Ewingella americana]MCI1861977.1 5-formyltetrahydrofolate cyclo-ligase [Ewingella americana]MCI2144303.1 5-formyltetrahydrofolate cyclo-ligase [Ewingella americana]MCI2162184.1 5-formyltetrahydrofolate cyclo-ligase [Ewingella americana]